MAISLGSIIVELLANTGGFIDGMSKASYEGRKRTKEIHKSFDEMGSKIGNSLQGVFASFGQFGNVAGELSRSLGEAFEGIGKSSGGLALGVTALGGLAVAAIAAAVSLAELAKGGAEIVERFSLISQKTGISIRDLQGFEAVGKTVGISLEDMVIGMRKFDSALAGVGKNAAAGALLRELGVTAKTNKAALLETADAFKLMEDGPEKAALAVQLFGKAGLNMIPFLNKGAEGMKEFNDLVDQYGPKIGKEAVAANEKYKQSTVQLDLQWQHFKVTIEQGVLPVLTKLNSIDWGSTWAGFKGALLDGGPAGAAKAVAELGVARAVAANEAHKEADAEEAKRSASEKIVELQEAAFEKLKAGGSAAYALEQARSKMVAEIDIHHFDIATKIFDSLPALQKAAELEALRVENAKRLAASYAAIKASFADGSFNVKPNLKSAPLDPSQSKGLESLFGKQPGKDPLEGAPDLGKSSFLTNMVPELGKTLNVGADYLKSFYEHWKAQSQGTENSVNDDYNKQLAELQGMLALGEVSEKDAKDVYLKIQQERFDGLKRLREQNGTSTFKDAWTDMFAQIEVSGKDFARSITSDIGNAIEGLNQQLSQFIATGKGLDLKKLGQGLTESITSSILKKGESSILSMFGLGGGKADGSTQTNALWVQFANGGFGGVGGSPDTSLAGILGGNDNSNSGNGGLLGGLFGGGSGDSSGDGGGGGNFFTKLLGNLFGGGRAGGGDVQPGKAYMVGEKRPELFLPRSAGTIVPSFTGGDSKTIAVTQHFHISTPDADSFKKSQGQISSAMGQAAQRGFARNGR